MESIIKINDITVNEWQNTIIAFKVVDEKNNPVNGKTVVKINHETVIRGNVVNGEFSQELNCYNLHDDSYDVDVIYGGNDDVDPTDARVKLYINKTPITLSINDLQNASYRLTKWIDVNKRLPGRIAINNHQITVGNLLELLSNAIINIDNNNTEDIELKWAGTPKVSSENITENIEISKDDYKAIAEEILNYIDDKEDAPSTIELEDGNIGFMNLIYTFSKIVANSSSTGLISSVYVRPWKEIIAK